MIRRIATPWRIGHVLLVMLVSGCAKKADTTQAPEGEASGDLAALEQQLAAREDQLRTAGIALPAKEMQQPSSAAKAAGEAPGPAPASPPRPETSEPAAAGADIHRDEKPTAKSEERGGRCEQVCEISAAICGLQDQICGLLPRHRDDPRYQAACDRAVADCQISTEACHGCSDT